MITESTMNRLNSTVSVDSAHVQSRLQELLHRLLVQNSNCPFESPHAIPIDADLSSLAVTSIDFLEFALSVEKEFQVEILDTITPDELPQTLAAWHQQVCVRLAL
jgi:acyl carrier protein